MIKQMIREWCTEHERSLAYLARKAGMSDSQLNHILAGRRNAGIKVLTRLEMAMGVVPGTLIQHMVPAGTATHVVGEETTHASA